IRKIQKAVFFVIHPLRLSCPGGEDAADFWVGCSRHASNTNRSERLLRGYHSPRIDTGQEGKNPGDALLKPCIIW
ncbi:MAG: hypothetical protein AABZ68_03535, partial [Candidatus Deferrimicrobiota bacterium]